MVGYADPTFGDPPAQNFIANCSQVLIYYGYVLCQNKICKVTTKNAIENEMQE
jgi:hypothetical protein